MTTVPRRRQSHLTDTSRAAQNARLLERLRHDSADTFTIMQELNICRPGARICDLRQAGYEIITTRTTLLDEWERPHSGIAVYTLLAEPGSAA